MEKWEYLVINVSYRDGSNSVITSVSSNYQRIFSNILKDKLEAYLDQLSKDGWELSHIHYVDDGQKEAYYFKRPVA